MKSRLTTYKAGSWRHYALLSFFLLIGALLFGRILFLGETEKMFLQTAGKSSESLETLPGVRGNIFDRNGAVLALSTPGYSISINPSQTDFEDSEIGQIADFLGVDKKVLSLKISKNKHKKFLFIGRKISREVSMALKSSKIGGLQYEPEYHRYYPAAETASHVIGKTNIDGVFAAGDIVRGASLVVWGIKDGRDVAVSIKNFLESKELSKEKVA